jgi:hypothetical protein
MKIKNVYLILTLVALVFLFIPSASIYKSVKIKQHGATAESTVTGKRRNSKGGMAQVTVSFTTPDGKQVSAAASKHGHVSKGDKVMVWYDPAFPQKIDFGDTIGYNMRGVIIGALLFIFGLYFFIRYTIKDKAVMKLQSSGKKIAAEFVSFYRNEKYRMGDKNPWVIKCRWTDQSNNHEYAFVSKDYIIDPAPYLDRRTHIDVFIDPADPSKYYMDVSFMPKGNNTIG